MPLPPAERRTRTLGDAGDADGAATSAISASVSGRGPSSARSSSRSVGLSALESLPRSIDDNNAALSTSAAAKAARRRRASTGAMAGGIAAFGSLQWLQFHPQLEPLSSASRADPKGLPPRPSSVGVSKNNARGDFPLALERGNCGVGLRASRSGFCAISSAAWGLAIAVVFPRECRGSRDAAYRVARRRRPRVCQAGECHGGPRLSHTATRAVRRH